MADPISIKDSDSHLKEIQSNKSLRWQFREYKYSRMCRKLFDKRAQTCYILRSTYRAVRREDAAIFSPHAKKKAQSEAEVTATSSLC